MQRFINIGAGLVLLICLVLVLSDCSTNKDRALVQTRGERATLITEGTPSTKHVVTKAKPDPGRFGGSDISFVYKVRRDIPTASDAPYSRIVKLGKYTCTGLKRSVSSVLEMRVFVGGYLRAASQTMPRDDAGDFLGLSIGTYCPQFIKYLR